MHDIVVLSDLHIGRGRNPETGRFHSLETFFYDDDLRRFLHWSGEDARARGTTLKVVFNGDTFDLLRMEMECEDDTATRRELRFGADPTPEVAAKQVAAVLEGHPVLVDAMADVLASGHEIVMLPGNHDLEVQWTPVQDEIRRAVRQRLGVRPGVDATAAMQRFSFAPWFVHEPGRVWIEHGCQYDPENAYRYNLRSRLSAGVDPRLLELDMPLGNFFQRYLYNAFGALTFIVPSTRANARYSRWLLLHEPRMLVTVLLSHAPFMWQVLRRLSRPGAKQRPVLAEAHEAELAQLAETSGLGEKLREIDALKTTRLDITQAAREYGLQALRFTSIGSALALACVGLWASGFFAINEINSGFGLKALLFLALNFVMITALGVATTYAVFRDSPSPSPWPQRRAAEEIVRMLDVPIVTFGHTHEEVIWRLHRHSEEKAWYFNTGTWIAVFTHDVLMPRERVQFTFLRVKGQVGELLHWSPGRGEPVAVILLDELHNDAPLAPVGAAAQAA